MEDMSSYIAGSDGGGTSDCGTGLFKLGKYSERVSEGDIGARNLVRVIFNVKD